MAKAEHILLCYKNGAVVFAETTMRELLAGKSFSLMQQNVKPNVKYVTSILNKF